MRTVGGAISGYCATASRLAARKPASTMMMAMTPANAGRWMKKRDISGRSATSARLLHHHRHARAQAHEVVHDHRVAALQPIEHHPVGAQPGAGADRARHRL